MPIPKNIRIHHFSRAKSPLKAPQPTKKPIITLTSIDFDHHITTLNPTSIPTSKRQRHRHGAAPACRGGYAVPLPQAFLGRGLPGGFDGRQLLGSTAGTQVAARPGSGTAMRKSTGELDENGGFNGGSIWIYDDLSQEKW